VAREIADAAPVKARTGEKYRREFLVGTKSSTTKFSIRHFKDGGQPEYVALSTTQKELKKK